MTTDCPVTMCQIDEEIKYDYTLAPDEQSNVKVKNLVYKFDDQPMSQYQLEGSIFIDDFEFGIDYPVEEIKFVGIIEP